MDSGPLIFDSTSSSCSSRPGYMLILGGSGNSIFRERNEGARTMLSMEESVNKKRPFFTFPEELLEEEYYDEQLPEKKRRLAPEQVHMLERSFEADNKLEPERKGELAKKLGLQPRQVAVWFQNRRARWKTKQLEHDYDRLKAAYDSLLADHDSLLKDNEHLRSQVAILNEQIRINEMASEDPAGDPTAHAIGVNPASNANKSDQLSAGSGRSAVVDCEGRQLVDSGGSGPYLPHGFGVDVGPVVGGGGGGGAGPEEDDIGSDDGCNYLPAGGGLMFGDHGGNLDDAADNSWWGVWN